MEWFFRPRPVNLTGLDEALQQLYHPSECNCGACLVTLANDDIGRAFEALAKQLHARGWDGSSIPRDLYFSTAKQLAEAITGNIKETEYNDPQNATAQRLLSNVYQFSGAKSFTQAALMSEQLVDDKGQIKPFNRYLSDVRSTDRLYNERYLEAEYNHAIACAQSAESWHQWGLDDWLTYSTAGDDRVRKSHQKLDGLTLQASNEVWNRIYPPNDWGCRCHVAPGDKPIDPVGDQAAARLGKDAVTNPIFDNNPGKSGIVFKDDHPYFQSTKGVKELEAVKNYGLQSVDRIMSGTARLPAPLHMDTETDYYIWWDKMVKEHGAGKNAFALTDKMGAKVIFEASPDRKNTTKYFRDYITRKPGEKRHEYAANLVETIQKPDEIWSRRVKGGNTVVDYIKYFNDYPHVVTTVNDGKLIKAQTMYRRDLEKYYKTFDARRTGALLYKK